MGYLLSNDPEARGRVSDPARLQRSQWHCADSPPPALDRRATPPLVHWGHDQFARQFPGRGGWQLLFEGYLDREHARLDAETLIDPERFEADPVERLRGLAGAYTLIAWQPQTGEIIATRDRTGARTLYFIEHRGHLTLATSSDWVVQASGCPRREEPRFIVSLFALQQAPPPGLSAFEGVRELMPGEVLRYRGSTLTITHTPRDFEALIRAGQRKRRADDWADEFFHLLNNAVISCLPPEGDVACMLSGGLDSGPTAVLADAELHAQGRKLRAVSWSLKDFPDCDETQWIQMAAERLHHPVDFRDMSHALPFSRLDESMIVPDLPIYNGFRLLVNDCYERAASLGCRVVLNASTGDQIYPKRQWVDLDRWRRGQYACIWDDHRRACAKGGIRVLLRDPALRFLFTRWFPKIRRSARAPGWLSEDARALWSPPSSWPPESAIFSEPDYARQLFGAPMGFEVAQEIGMGQRHGIDRRDPFANEALLEFILQAPMDLSWRSGVSKAIARRSLRHHLPRRFLMKDRTGLLYAFHTAGRHENRNGIQFLIDAFDKNWAIYLREPALSEALQGSSEIPEIVLSQTVGYCLWTSLIAQTKHQTL